MDARVVTHFVVFLDVLNDGLARRSGALFQSQDSGLDHVAVFRMLSKFYLFLGL